MTVGLPLAAGPLRDGHARRVDGLLEAVLQALDAVGSSQRACAFWVPGRIEVLGKHTDYAGGRSLICAVEQGFAVAAVPRPDDRVRVLDVAGRTHVDLALDPNLPTPAVPWARYPATVLGRVARNFPDARQGADIAFLSDLPPASGMSSSSAFMVAVFLAIAEINALAASVACRREIDSAERLAAYLATVENGQSFGSLTGDRGVGTFGGSEDHTAMLCCRGGALSQYSFCPVRHERQVPLPEAWTFVVAVSGVMAEKTGAARDAYNRASLAVRAILDVWQAATGRQDASLAQAVERGGREQVREVIRQATVDGFTSDLLVDRLDQFVEESEIVLPAAADALAAGDLTRFGTLVDRSQDLTERLLRNQVPETVALASSARALGASAASAFGAGFGGSVWALVPAAEQTSFVERWRASYHARFPDTAPRSSFLATRPGPAAMALTRPQDRDSQRGLRRGLPERAATA